MAMRIQSAYGNRTRMAMRLQSAPSIQPLNKDCLHTTRTTH